MEFRYRGGDDRLPLSPPPPPPPAGDGGGGNGDAAGDRGKQAAVGPVQQESVAAAAAVLVGASQAAGGGGQSMVPTAAFLSSPVIGDVIGELQRKMEKERIREQFLQQEVQRWTLEAEVRREMAMESLLSMRAAAACALGSTEPPTAMLLGHLGSGWTSASTPVEVKGATSVAAETVAEAAPPLRIAEVQSEPQTLTTVPSRRKDPGGEAPAAAVSVLSAATSRKKQKLELTCGVCGVMATSEKCMEEHLCGKTHKKKAGHPQPTAGDDVAMPAADLTFRTTKEAVAQIDGHFMCQLCNVTAPDSASMMCHLEGSRHGKARSRRQVGELPAVAVAADGGVTEAVHVVVDVDGVAHTLRREDDLLLCECCSVTSPTECVMRSHLSGKKHKSKAKAAAIEQEKKVALALAQPKAKHVSVAGVVQGQGNDLTAAQAKGEAVAAAAAVAAELAMPQAKAADAGASKTAAMTLEERAREVYQVAMAQETADVNSSAMPAKETARAALAAAVEQEKKEALALAQPKVKDASVAGVVREQGNDSTAAQAKAAATVGASAMPPAKAIDSGVSKTAAMPLEEMVKEMHQVGMAQQTTDINSSAVPAKETARAGEAAGKAIKVQVEGTVCILLKQADGKLSCEPCGERGLDKDSMVLHLYTRTHKDNVRRAEELKQAAVVVAADGPAN